MATMFSLRQHVARYKTAIENQNRDYNLRLKKMQDQLEVADKGKQRIQKKLEDAIARLNSASANKFGVSLAVKKDLQVLIESQAKNYLWNVVKFIQSPEEEMMAATMLLMKFAPGLPEEEIETKEDREALANTYKMYIRRAIFQRRNYVAAEHKKVMLKRMKEKGSMPTVPQLLKCLKRDITGDEDFEIFVFYWEELLPKQVGSNVWSKEVRNYTTISNAIRKEIKGGKMPMITPEDEAFTVLVVANSRDHWIKDLEGKKDSVNQQGKQKRPDYSGLYTNTEAGQNQWGGWKEEGLKLFNDYVDMNRAARRKKKAREVEEACLVRIKKKYDIVCRDYKEQSNLDKKRKRKGGDDALDKPVKKKPLGTIRPDFHGIFFDNDDMGFDIHCNDSDEEELGKPSLPMTLRCKCTLPSYTL